MTLIQSGIWFQDDLWEKSSLCFLSSSLKPWYPKCSMIDSFLGDAFRVLSCLFFSTVLQCGSGFLTGGVVECDSAHRHMWHAQCMLYIICANRCTLSMVPYVPVRVTRNGLVAHQYTYAPHRCRTSQYNRNFIPLSVSGGFQELGQYFFIVLSYSIPCYLPLLSLSLLSVWRMLLWGWGL